MTLQDVAEFCGFRRSASFDYQDLVKMRQVLTRRTKNAVETLRLARMHEEIGALEKKVRRGQGLIDSAIEAVIKDTSNQN